MKTCHTIVTRLALIENSIFRPLGSPGWGGSLLRSAVLGLHSGPSAASMLPNATIDSTPPENGNLIPDARLIAARFPSTEHNRHDGVCWFEKCFRIARPGGGQYGVSDSRDGLLWNFGPAAWLHLPWIF